MLAAYCPAAHEVHFVAAELAANVPAAHSWHLDWPGLTAYCPAAHDEHVEAVLAPMESEAVPAAQD